MKLRTHLVILVAAITVPVLVLAGVVMYLVHQRDQIAVEAGLADTADALAAAVSREVEATVGALNALAVSADIERGDLRAVYEQARRLQQLHGGWKSVFLSDGEGHERFTLLRPFGESLPDLSDNPDVMTVLRTGRPYVSDLVIGNVSGQRIIRVHVPAIRDNVTRYVLTATLVPQTLGAILAGHESPSGLLATLLDRRGVIVAGTRDAQDWVGHLAQRDLLEQTAKGPHGIVRARTLDGQTFIAAFERVPRADYTVVAGRPLALAAESQRSLWLFGLACAGVFGLAMLAAMILARRVARPVLSLQATARALAAGEPLPPPVHPGISEVEVVRAALVDAAGIARERATDREERQAVEAAQRRSMFLARASAVLASTLEYEGALREVARLLVPAIADGCSVDILHEDGRIQRLANLNRDPVKEAAVFRLAERYERDADRPAARVMASGVSELISDFDDRQAARISRDPDVVALLRTINITSMILVPLRTGGRVVGAFTLVACDGSRRFGPVDLALAEELGQRVGYAMENARLYRESEAAGRAKDEFLAMLSHELRNPLSAISSAVGVLDHVAKPEERGAGARRVIARQVSHLRRLLDDLLDVARVTSGKIVLKRGAVDLGQVVTRCQAALTAAGQTARHHIDMRAASVWVDGDETRLEQIATNLLVNALRYTPPGGSIRVSVEADDGRACLAVEDTGLGIAPDLLPRVFDLFVQGDKTADRTQGGLGIGLTLVKRLAEMHGGGVSAASEGPGRGSRFTVWLPRTSPPASAAASPAGRGEPREPRRVLIIEDYGDTREMLEQVLRLEGHDVWVAADGVAGLEEFARVRPDVALVDLGLPGIDGYEVVRRLRATPEGRRALLVALTGYGRAEDRARALAAGFDRHLVKPVDATALARIIAEHAPASA